LAKRLEKFILQQADMIMPISNYLRDKAIADGALRRKIRVAPHGIDFSSFTSPSKGYLREKFRIEDGKLVLSCVARLSRENYVYDIVKLVRKLVNRLDNFVLILAGDGKEGGNLKREIEHEPELREHLLLPGFLPHNDVIELYKISDVNVCLLAGFSLIEACAAACPIVAYDIEWHKEIIIHGESGFLIPKGDIDKLADAVSYLLNHKEKALSMGKMARKFAFERHSIERSAAIKKEYYNELLTTGHRLTS
jgi:glycosyltransferase involved in cell wall biosynthesis